MKKVVILCPYSYPSACGIWSRVYSDAIALKNQGYDVSVFSSNIIKGTKNTSSDYEELDGLKLYRFKVLFSLGGTSMFWNFYSKMSQLNPDIIHTHGFRHPHSLFSFLWAKLHSKTVLLTTHAPFEKDPRRSVILKLVDIAYDIIFGWWELKLYSTIIRICNWEIPYLNRLGAKNTILIPNGIKELFFVNSPKIDSVKLKQVIYMGRIDPVKRPDWLLSAAAKLNNLKFKIVGPLSGYDDFKTALQNVDIIKKTYTSSEFINEVDNSDIYVLPSAREAMPFTLLEAMSRAKFVISSSTNGGKEVIADGKNGFIVDNSTELSEKIDYIYENWDNLQSMRYNALETAKNYTADASNQKLIDLYSKLV